MSREETRLDKIRDNKIKKGDKTRQVETRDETRDETKRNRRLDETGRD